MKKLLASLLTIGCLQFVVPLYAQVPGIINYQGRVIVGGTNFDGPGLFQFALVDTGATNAIKCVLPDWNTPCLIASSASIPAAETNWIVIYKGITNYFNTRLTP